MAEWEKCEGCGLKYYAEDGHKCKSSVASAGSPLSRYIEAWRLANLVSLNLRDESDFGTDEWKNRRDRICAEAMKKYLEG